MQIDFTEIIKRYGKDKPNLKTLNKIGSYASGWDLYELKGINKILFSVNEESQIIKAKANFPYFWQGHNFNFSNSEMVEAIQYTSSLIDLNLFDAKVKSFEFGSVLLLDASPHEYLSNHLTIKGKPFQTYLAANHRNISGKEYKNELLKLKLYDFQENLKHKAKESIRATLRGLNEYDRHQHYLKIEAHYKSPEKHFLNGSLLVNDILKPDFLQNCKDDLINLYRSIMKTGIVKTPTNKKDLSSGGIAFLMLYELGMLHQFDAESLMIDKINSIPESTLNREDKKARKRFIKEGFKKMKTLESSRFDLSELLESTQIR
jgi:hypothetical protein